MNIQIRPEKTVDVAIIADVTEAAFRDAPHAAHTEQFIVNALRRSGALAVSLVAELDGVVVGHVAVSPVTVADGSTGWFGLGPISVLPTLQGRGIGSRLMHAALDALRERAAAGCMLVGDPSYYRRFGFRPEPGLTYPGVPSEYFMVVTLGGPVPQGVVTFHDAFSAKE